MITAAEVGACSRGQYAFYFERFNMTLWNHQEVWLPLVFLPDETAWQNSTTSLACFVACNNFLHTNYQNPRTSFRCICRSCLEPLIVVRVRIVKNELGGSATQQELRDWGGHNGMNRGTGGLNPQPPINSNPDCGSRVCLGGAPGQVDAATPTPNFLTQTAHRNEYFYFLVFIFFQTD